MTTDNQDTAEALDAIDACIRHFTSTPSTLADSKARGNAHAAVATLRAALSHPAPSHPATTAGGWPCEIYEADFEANTITVHMLTNNYRVAAGKHMLVPAITNTGGTE